MLYLLTCFSKKHVHCQLEFSLCLHAWPLESLCTVSHAVVRVSGENDGHDHSFDHCCGHVIHVDLTLGTLFGL